MKNTEKLRWLETELAFVVGKTKENQQVFKEVVPAPASQDLVYQPEANDYWKASFWIGMLQLAKEMSGEQSFDQTIALQLASFKQRLEQRVELETHDIGFLYILSAIADYKLTGNQTSRKLALKAADLLMERYSEKAGIIQAWGDLEDQEQGGRMIIDCLMNLPLLYFASLETGDPKYHRAAYQHAKQTQKYIVRPNYTTYHTYYFDTKTGEALHGKTQQGYSDDSCWARGQAWGIYGFTLSYLYTGDQSFIETAKQIANYFLQALPEDQVCYWDLLFTDGSGEERDSSAAAIAACGLLELAKQLPLSDPERAVYENAAVAMMSALQKDYTTKELPNSNGLLIHGVYDKKSNKGVDECMIWGDYFYMEALTRLARVWYPYW